MSLPPFATLPPIVHVIWPVYFTTLLLLVGLFVRATTNRNHGKRSERNRRAELGLAAILSGPLVGALLAGLAHAFGGIHPLDVAFNYIVFISIGSIAGFVVGIVFAVTCVLAPRSAPAKDSSKKPPGLWDEL